MILFDAGMMKPPFRRYLEERDFRAKMAAF